MPRDDTINEAVLRERLTNLQLEGVRLRNEGDLEGARAHFSAALLLYPKSGQIASNLSAILYQLTKCEAGASLGRRAVRYSPRDASVHSNLAVNLTYLGKIGEAERHMRISLDLEPQNPAMWFNYGGVLYRKNDFVSANKAYATALGMGFGTQEILNDYSLTLMAQREHFLRGLQAYEVRWKTLAKSPIWNFDLPEWKGEDLKDKRIIVHHEQGFGDSIMLCRFIQELEATGAKITMATHPALVRLMTENFPDIEVRDWDECGESPKDNWDFHSPMLSVARHLKISPDKISSEPYLSVSDTAKRIPGQIKVGICWASGDHGVILSQRRRIVPLPLFLELQEVAPIQLVSLQKGADMDIPYLGANDIIFDPMPRCADWRDTATVINALDLVISVDSAVAHLAGALGKPVLMLGPATRCWRWWGKTNGSPWYRNFKIFSQGHDLSWNAAMKKVVKEVEKRFN